jgi:hypothetical protein
MTVFNHFSSAIPNAVTPAPYKNDRFFSPFIVIPAEAGISSPFALYPWVRIT